MPPLSDVGNVEHISILLCILLTSVDGDAMSATELMNVRNILSPKNVAQKLLESANRE